MDMADVLAAEATSTTAIEGIAVQQRLFAMLEWMKLKIERLEALAVANAVHVERLQRRLEQLTVSPQNKVVVTSPFQQLPPELLSLIFYHATEYQYCPFGDPFPSLDWHILTRNRGPLRLMHVCHHWRETAINDTMLWSCIVIDFDRISSNLAGTEIVRTHLKHSQNRPLKIILLLRIEPLDNFHDLLVLLLSSISRWQCANIHLSSSAARASSISLFSTFPALETLTITYAVLSAIRKDRSLNQFLPRLHDLTVSGTFASTFQISGTCLSRLRLLSASETSVQVAFPTNDLQTIELRKAVMVSDTTSFITFPQVWKATIYSPPSLQTLVLPSLRTLCMGNPERVATVALFSQFLERSSCKIQKFVARGLLPELEVILEQLPPLQHLDLTGWHADSIGALALLDAVRRQLAPSPTILSVSLKQVQEELTGHVLDLVEEWSSPAHHKHPLTTVVMYFHAGIWDKRHLARVSSMHAKGIPKLQIIKYISRPLC